MRYLGLGAGVLLMAACRMPIHEIDLHPECGHDAVQDSLRIFPQIRFTYNVPEFNDCQRFIVPSASGLVYDSLFAIVAVQRLRDVDRRISNPSLATPLAATVAIIYADNDYLPLGIKRDNNCLYMWRVPGAGSPQMPGQWSARMVSVGLTTSCRDIAASDLQRGTALQVTPQQADGFMADADYPEVARWDWDSVHSRQYVGIKCGAAWCEIHNGAFTPSLPLPVSNATPTPVKRVRLIKGWYDQQLLATRGPNGKLVPSTVMGTIVPDVDLGAKMEPDFINPVHVADISLASPNPQDPALRIYAKKFNLALTDVDHPVSLWIKKPNTPLSSGYWSGTLVRPGTTLGAGLGRNIMPRGVSTLFLSSGYHVPAVARWRWMKQDEGSWARCAEGCCELSDF